MGHNRLRRPGCNSQLKIERDSRGKERLVYTEDPLQKTNQGGLVCKNLIKRVCIYPSENQNRCPVYYFKKYVSLLPQSTSCAKLYLRVRKNFKPNVWYCDQPYGFNKIKSTVREVCKMAGLVGKFTNHSLRTSCTSRMYKNKIPEQLIKEVTGHRSECVRTYKRMPDELREIASKTVSGVGPKKVDECEKLVEAIVDSDKDEEDFLSVEQMMANVSKTRSEIRRKKFNKDRLRLKCRGNCISIDLNVNMKYKNKVKKAILAKCK